MMSLRPKQAIITAVVAAEGAKAVQIVKAPGDAGPAMQEFRDAMAKYEPGQAAGFIALWGWTAAKIFGRIARTIQGPITSDSLIKAYEQAKNIDPGVGPVMNFSPTQHIGTRDVQKVEGYAKRKPRTRVAKLRGRGATPPPGAARSRQHGNAEAGRRPGYAFPYARPAPGKTEPVYPHP